MLTPFFCESDRFFTEFFDFVAVHSEIILFMLVSELAGDYCLKSRTPYLLTRIEDEMDVHII